MTNRLARETSPYLRQHAGNPVDWWPWCDEALAAARAENKPILLSIGYAACHWCHVMAHESFEDEATARVMNALYVNIKVDREERPDIDKVYQLAHQALARRGGGWPLTVFLTPDDLMPFFAGTYFPKTPRYGQPAFVQVLQGVRAWFDAKPDEVRAQNGALARFLEQQGTTSPHADALDDRPIRAALERMATSFDRANGGHLGAPKFPHASEIGLLLAHGERTLSNGMTAREMARLTLSRMAERGLRDHLGGGFFRYCVDAAWDIPHFEKMLYDNAALLPFCARMAREDDDPALAAATRDEGSWLVGEMTASGGGFFSSLDADSDGEEGACYIWQRDDIRAALDDAEFAVVEKRFGLDGPPNFEGRAWHLRAVASLDEVAASLDLPREAADARWQSARQRLLRIRGARTRPGLDDKILTAWNALMIGGIARASRESGDLAALFAEAERALDFLHANAWQNGRLHATHSRGETKIAAYLDDHAFLLDALLAMLRVRWSTRDLEWAIVLADALIERFEDRDGGGFFFTAHEAERLPQRSKSFVDESLPSGNGVAARALLRLGHLLGEPRYLDAAERTLRAGWDALLDHPEACCEMLLALGEFLDPPAHVVVRHRDPGAASTWRGMLDETARAIDAYFIPADATVPAGVLAQQRMPGAIVAFLCKGTACDPPLGSTGELAAALRRAQ
ncbi:MAG TPA: thioredoxin domain-containing protein [Rhodanobacteraceae bacterium]|nr:thioredoxin domain-containing protein [Rhodanobacteraceae bacterium]